MQAAGGVASAWCGREGATSAATKVTETKSGCPERHQPARGPRQPGAVLRVTPEVRHLSQLSARRGVGAQIPLW